MKIPRKQQIRRFIVAGNIIYIFWIVFISFNLFFVTQGVTTLAGIDLLSARQVACILPVLTMSMIIFNIYLTREWIYVERTEQQLAEEQIARELSEESTRQLRCQRHDFLNHLQVILGYLQIEKVDRAINYIKSINNELAEVRPVNKLHMPEASVLLVAKREEAKRYNIELKYNIKTDLSGVQIKEHDLVKILSNLIDNAIFELRKLGDAAEKKINISIEKKGENLFVEVFNTDTYISNKEKVFLYGYTSKGSEGTGTGLYIVKELVENKYRGRVEVESEKDYGTSFKIAI